MSRATANATDDEELEGPVTDDKTILLVEDNPDQVVLTLRALRNAHPGHRVVVARDGSEALVRLGLQESGAGTVAPPDLVLLDLQLPGLDGHEVLRRIRAHGPTRHVPVVVLTTSLDEKDRYNAYQAGANSYIRKPVSLQELREAIDRVVHYWTLLNQSPPVTRR